MDPHNSHLNVGWEFEYLEAETNYSKTAGNTENLSIHMEKESFMSMLGSNDEEKETNSRDETNFSTLSTSIDSGIASSFDSCISMDSSFPNSQGSFLTDYSDALSMHTEPEYQALECDHTMRNYPTQSFSENQTVYGVPNNSTAFPACDGVMKRVVDHSGAINLSVSGMDDSSNFDRYTRATYADMEARRQDLAMDYAELKDVLPSYIQSTESRYKDTLDDYNTTEELLENKPLSPISSNEDTESRIADITEYIEAETLPTSKNKEYTKKKKKAIPKETTEDTKKYKRRKDLSYESVVEEMAEQKDICLRCQVCGGVASGYHYGAETCGACKIFFRRNATKPPRHTCQHKPDKDHYSVSCPGCRLEKSFKIGMNTAASRKGRYSYKRRYEYQRRSVQQVQAVQRLKTGQEVIIFTPTKSTEEVIDLANRISDMFLSCGTYSPRFFENLDDIEKKFYETKFVNETAYGVLEPLNDERYKHIFTGTGIDIDGRQQAYRQRFLSFERRIRSYVLFAKKLHGFNELPKEDQESMFKFSSPYIACLSEYRACIVKKGIRIHPEGFVENSQDIRELYSEDYVEMLFRVAGKIQAMNYTENERNLLKLMGFFTSEFCKTAEGSRLADKHQDFAIRAFDKLIRATRKGADCAKFIANSIMILSDIREIKESASTALSNIVSKFPFLIPSPLVREIIDITEDDTG